MIAIKTANILLELSPLDELFNLILELIAIGGIVPVILVIMAV